MEEIINDVEITLKEFATCSEMLTSDMILELPLELQIKLMNAHVDLTVALKKYNSEVKQIIVLASMMNRI